MPDMCHMPVQVDSHLYHQFSARDRVLGAVTQNPRLRARKVQRYHYSSELSFIDEETETQLGNLPKVTELICRGA